MNLISKGCLNAISRKMETSKTVQLKGRFGYFPRVWSIALNWSSYATNESEEVDRGINFFIPDIEKFPPDCESQRDQNPSLPIRSLDVRWNSRRRERPEAIVLQMVKERRGRIAIRDRKNGEGWSEQEKELREEKQGVRWRWRNAVVILGCYKNRVDFCESDSSYKSVRNFRNTVSNEIPTRSCRWWAMKRKYV